jgi:(2Fe-2S) ferredoxin
MTKYDIPGEELPKLMLPNLLEPTKYKEEYIPPKQSRANLWLRQRYLHLRIRLNKDIYYWQVRFLLMPLERKCYDIDFIMHVLNEHNGKPEQKTEKRHYEYAKTLYLSEINYIIDQMNKDETRDAANRIGHPYAYAYLERWKKSLDTPYVKTWYHGVSASDFRDILKMHLSKELQLNIEHNKVLYRQKKISKKDFADINIYIQERMKFVDNLGKDTNTD